ncbi:MAG: ABC transporter substrate-binding protein [Coriobacteriia bacterium]|nr:ABC transporter substrate-binding protein [Coriobacteriia bacterium]MBN2821824.1 ABC transporter substrate-binding protein [Coriobacteriia bacterium]
MGRKALAIAMATVLCVAGLTLGGCSDESRSDSSGLEPYKIGVVVSLTGSYSGLGVPEKKAIELEAELLNEAGGINGRMVELFFEDDATDAAKAAAAATSLIEREGVIAVIGATGTGQTMAMRTDIDRAAVPQVSMAGGSVVTADFDELVFQTPWPNRVVVPFTLNALAAKGITRIALISDSGGYGADGHDVVLASAAAAGVEIVADETFNLGDTDMTAQLTKMRSQSPDAVLMWTAGSEAAIVAKNMQQLGFDVPLVGSPGNGRVEFLDGAGSAADGFSFAAGKILLPEAYGEGSEAFTVATEFIDRYTERYGTAPDIFAGHAYDAFLIIADALGRVDGDVTPAALRDAIEATDGLIGVGGTFSYSADDHNGLSETDLVMYRVDGGQWVLDE